MTKKHATRALCASTTYTLRESGVDKTFGYSVTYNPDDISGQSDYLLTLSYNGSTLTEYCTAHGWTMLQEYNGHDPLVWLEYITETLSSEQIIQYCDYTDEWLTPEEIDARTEEIDAWSDHVNQESRSDLFV